MTKVKAAHAPALVTAAANFGPAATFMLEYIFRYQLVSRGGRGAGIPREQDGMVDFEQPSERS